MSSTRTTNKQGYLPGLDIGRQRQVSQGVFVRVSLLFLSLKMGLYIFRKENIKCIQNERDTSRFQQEILKKGTQTHCGNTLFIFNLLAHIQ